MKKRNEALDVPVENGTVSHIAVRVGKGDTVLCDAFRGGVDESTLFDMASVTKIVVTTSLALIAFDKGLLSPDDLVARFYPNDKGLTVRHIIAVNPKTRKAM